LSLSFRNIQPAFSVNTGAGAAISDGKKARALTATRASKKINTISKGLIYWRKKFIVRATSFKNENF
jgi:hypothetical protein